MKLCRFVTRQDAQPRVGALHDGGDVADLSALSPGGLSALLHDARARSALSALDLATCPRLSAVAVRLCAPVDQQEVWAAGVTYLRSKQARMTESDFSATAYDRVYDAERPELFFKALANKVVGPGAPVGIRHDARWTVPEPELALVLDPAGALVGVTIGNDMSARDIEGENLLYLPQAKIYRGSCALGPCVRVGVTEAEVRTWTVGVTIQRAGAEVFAGETSLGRIKRRFEELAGFLFRSQEFPHGAVLLTGTGVVPPDDFSLRAGDVVRIAIEGVGTLENPVIEV